MNNKKNTSRRTFLRRLLGLGAVGFGAGALVSACGDGSEEAAMTTPCTDLSDLTEQQITLRENLEYVSETPIPEKRCDNCQFYIPAEAGESCGGCQLFAGAVAAGGYCTSWVQRTGAAGAGA